MKTLSLVIVLILLPFTAFAERVALVMGNSEYQWVPKLANPQNDSAAISSALLEQGFDVTIADNLDLNGMRRALRSFREKADQADLAVVYYAGHGIEIGGVNFLVPVDANLVDERDANIELFQVDDILSQISGAKRMKMLVLDACRNNPFITKMKRENSGRNVGRGLANIEVSDADTLIAYAAAAGEVTPDGEAGLNSPFTSAFVSALGGPPADVRRLLGIVRDEMRVSVPGAAPFVYSSLGGSEYVINPQSSEPVEEPVVEGAPEPAQAVSAQPFNENSIFIDFAKAEMGGTIRGWDDFLIRYETYELHPLFATALGKKGLLERQIMRNTAVPSPSQPASNEPQPTAPSAPVSGLFSIGDDETLAPNSTQTPAPTLTNTTPSAPAVQEPPQLTHDQAARSIQAFLKNRGCYRGSIDGVLGRGSSSGLSRFSKAAGTLIKVDRNSSALELNTALSDLSAAPMVECAVETAVRRRDSSPAPRAQQSGGETSGRKQRSWGCSGQNDAYHCLTD